MSKRQALRALKRQRMEARQGYQMHLLDLWFADEDSFPGGVSTRYFRHIAKRRMNSVRRLSIRP